MKKTKFLFGILVAAILGVFTACEETEDAIGPSLDLIGGNFISSDATVVGGDEIAFKWSATAGDAKLDMFTIYKDGNIIPDWNNVEISKDQNEAYSGADTLMAPAEIGTYTYLFVVTDKDGMADSVSVMITVESAPVTLNAFDVVLLGAQSSSEPSCASLVTGTRYAISGDDAKTNSDKVDIVHYNGSKGVALYSPSQADIQGVSAYAIDTWATKNATKMSATSLTSAQFDAIATDTDLETAGTPDGDFVAQLAVDDVVVFETADGKKGVFRVDALVDEAAGSVTINVKVMP